MAKEKLFTDSLSSVDCTCDLLDKEAAAAYYVKKMFTKSLQMFEYSGLPDTIPAYRLEQYLQINGQVAITKVEGKLYALPGYFGGAQDPYYRPTLYNAANPALGEKLKGNLRIINNMEPYNKDQGQMGDCVLIRNDSFCEGLRYMFTRYATQLTENDVSIRSAQINARAQIQISASSDTDALAAQRYLDDLVAGKMTAVASKQFLEGIKAQNVSTTSANAIIQLIELQQYLKASWYNDIGLNANFNMKREYQSEEELLANTDTLLPLIDDMLMQRKLCFEAVNKAYNTSISVEKNSSWEYKQDSRDTEIELKEAEKNAIERSDTDV